MKCRAFGFVAVLSACLGLSSVAQGAAALESGAQTSAKPKAKDPVKRQMQVAADPIGIIDFQFTLHYDPVILHVALGDDEQPLIRGINGYVLGDRNNQNAAPFVIDSVGGYVTVRGYWPAVNGEAVPDYEIDVYDVMFELNPFWRNGTPIPVDTPFIIYSLGITQTEDNAFFGVNDFMRAGEVTGPGTVRETRFYPVNEIIEANTGLVSIGGEGSGIPEPAGMTALLPAGLLLMRRRK